MDLDPLVLVGLAFVDQRIAQGQPTCPPFAYSIRMFAWIQGRLDACHLESVVERSHPASETGSSSACTAKKYKNIVTCEWFDN